MQIFYTENHQSHNPPYEIYDGQKADYAEVPDRLTGIAAALRESGYNLQQPTTFGLEHIQGVHQQAYVDFVQQRSQTLGDHDVLFPSYFMTDTYAPITNGTFDAARQAVDVALSGAQSILDGERVAYSLCRPPGHHAMHHSMGGYCYFNNAAVAANLLANRGRVAILDIDYHHGNGTQDTFYDRDDVLYVSIHADPTSAYPYSSGFKDEQGRGAGKGHTRNFPIPTSTTNQQYMETLGRALSAVREFQPDYLVVSLGFDTFKDDPIGGMSLTASAYEAIGQAIYELELPTLLVQEGGYNAQALPELVTTFISAFS